ncbi:MAG TPA: GNAT family N-acetyltransferase [Blastocatellia bacterium]|nr:GNAT family N-acetyltransferase [Blastocatellia bacterium]
MLFADLTLARRLEATDAAAGADYVRAYAKLHPGSGAATLEVMGGSAAFAGVDSPVTQAFALGLDGAVTAEELDELEEFFRKRGAAVNIELCPLADASLRELLGERGYRVIEFSNVLVRELTPGDAKLTVNPAVTVRQPEPTDEGAYADVVSRGFFEGGEIPQFMKDVSEVFAHVGMVRFLAEVDGRAAGGGGVAVHNGVATLGGAATLPEFRNRGVQTALIQARLAFAAAAGCDLAMVTTMPGSASYRNAEREGFRIVYTRCKLTRDVAD